MTFYLAQKYKKETLGMVNQNFIKSMKDDGILINVSRGGLYQSLDVLYQALQERNEFRIGTDVLPKEPPEDHPLLEAWRTQAPWLKGRFLLTPHSSFYSEQACYELRRFSVEAAYHVLTDHHPYNWVNPW